MTGVCAHVGWVCARVCVCTGEVAWVCAHKCVCGQCVSVCSMFMWGEMGVCAHRGMCTVCVLTSVCAQVSVCSVCTCGVGMCAGECVCMGVWGDVYRCMHTCGGGCVHPGECVRRCVSFVRVSVYRCILMSVCVCNMCVQGTVPALLGGGHS